MSSAAIAVISMLAGVAICLLGFGLYRVYRTLQEMVASVKSAVEAVAKLQAQVQPLFDNSLLKTALLAQDILTNQNAELVKRFDALIQALNLFNEFMFKTPPDNRGPVGTGAFGESKVYAYDETEAAVRESAETLRKEAGIETDPMKVPPPTIQPVGIDAPA